MQTPQRFSRSRVIRKNYNGYKCGRGSETSSGLSSCSSSEVSSYLSSLLPPSEDSGMACLDVAGTDLGVASLDLGSIAEHVFEDLHLHHGNVGSRAAHARRQGSRQSRSGSRGRASCPSDTDATETTLSGSYGVHSNQRDNACSRHSKPPSGLSNANRNTHSPHNALLGRTIHSNQHIAHSNQHIYTSNDALQSAVRFVLGFSVTCAEDWSLFELYRQTLDWLDPDLDLLQALPVRGESVKDRGYYSSSTLDVPSLALVLFLQEGGSSTRLAEARAFLNTRPWKVHHSEWVGGAVQLHPDNSHDYYILTPDRPLCSVRQIHCGCEHLRVMRYVTSKHWRETIDLYSLIIAQRPHVVKKDFALFTLSHDNSEYDLQFALKRLPRGTVPKKTRKAELYFHNIANIGSLVSLCPHPCHKMSEALWVTRDLDGNKIYLSVVQSVPGTNPALSPMQKLQQHQEYRVLQKRCRSVSPSKLMNRTTRSAFSPVVPTKPRPADDNGVFYARGKSLNNNNTPPCGRNTAQMSLMDKLSPRVYVTKKAHTSSIPRRPLSNSSRNSDSSTGISSVSQALSNVSHDRSNLSHDVSNVSRDIKVNRALMENSLHNHTDSGFIEEQRLDNLVSRDTTRDPRRTPIIGTHLSKFTQYDRYICTSQGELCFEEHYEEEEYGEGEEVVKEGCEECEGPQEEELTPRGVVPPRGLSEQSLAWVEKYVESQNQRITRRAPSTTPTNHMTTPSSHVTTPCSHNTTPSSYGTTSTNNVTTFSSHEAISRLVSSSPLLSPRVTPTNHMPASPCLTPTNQRLQSPCITPTNTLRSVSTTPTFNECSESTTHLNSCTTLHSCRTQTKSPCSCGTNNMAQDCSNCDKIDLQCKPGPSRQNCFTTDRVSEPDSNLPQHPHCTNTPSIIQKNTSSIHSGDTHNQNQQLAASATKNSCTDNEMAIDVPVNMASSINLGDKPGKPDDLATRVSEPDQTRDLTSEVNDPELLTPRCLRVDAASHDLQAYIQLRWGVKDTQSKPEVGSDLPPAYRKPPLPPPKPSRPLVGNSASLIYENVATVKPTVVRQQREYSPKTSGTEYSPKPSGTEYIPKTIVTEHSPKTCNEFSSKSVDIAHSPKCENNSNKPVNTNYKSKILNAESNSKSSSSADNKPAVKEDRATPNETVDSVLSVDKMPSNSNNKSWCVSEFIKQFESKNGVKPTTSSKPVLSTFRQRSPNLLTASTQIEKPPTGTPTQQQSDMVPTTPTKPTPHTKATPHTKPTTTSSSTTSSLTTTPTKPTTPTDTGSAPTEKPKATTLGQFLNQNKTVSEFLRKSSSPHCSSKQSPGPDSGLRNNCEGTINNNGSPNVNIKTASSEVNHLNIPREVTDLPRHVAGVTDLGTPTVLNEGSPEDVSHSRERAQFSSISSESSVFETPRSVSNHLNGFEPGDTGSETPSVSSSTSQPPSCISRQTHRPKKRVRISEMNNTHHLYEAGQEHGFELSDDVYTEDDDDIDCADEEEEGEEAQTGGDEGLDSMLQGCYNIKSGVSTVYNSETIATPSNQSETGIDANQTVDQSDASSSPAPVNQNAQSPPTPKLSAFDRLFPDERTSSPLKKDLSHVTLSPQVANQVTPSPQVTNQVTLSTEVKNQVTPSPQVTNQVTQSTEVTEQSTPSPLVSTNWQKIKENPDVGFYI